MKTGDLVHFHHGEGAVSLWHLYEVAHTVAWLNSYDVGLIVAFEQWRTMILTEHGIGYVYPSFCVPVT